MSRSNAAPVEFSGGLRERGDPNMQHQVTANAHAEQQALFAQYDRVYGARLARRYTVGSQPDVSLSVEPQRCQRLKSWLTAGIGLRDARLWAIGILHLSLKWHVGEGLMYSSLLGDAADSPVVSERGSRDQWAYGIGFMYSW